MARRVLIVEDSSGMRSIIRRIIVGLGFEVVEASNGIEGLARLDDGAPDVALVDWNMPEMNGIDFVKAVRAGQHRALPLVMVTTESEPGRVQTAMDAGADAYVTKPFTPQQIQEKLAGLGIR